MSNPRTIAIATSIAAELGNDWTVATQTPHLLARIVGAANRAITFSLEKVNGKERIAIRGTHSDDTDPRHYRAVRDAMPHGYSEPSITVAANKTAAAIAADIRRRLLPDLTELIVKWNARLAEQGAFQDATERNAKRIAAAIGGNVRSDGPSAPDPNNAVVKLYHSQTLPGMTCDIRVSGDSVYIDRLYLTPDETIAMLQALIAYRKANPTSDE